MKLSRRYAAYVSVILLFVVTIIIMLGVVFPWEKAIEQLELKHPGETAVLVGLEVVKSSSGDYKKGYYLLLPSKKVVVVMDREGELNISEYRMGLMYFIVSLCFVFFLFMYACLPVLKGIGRLFRKF
ncbi:hypothetical protein [Hahella ganghwensis]|uniref:hypothetical protein n=1 Tax=Hahella ganghwensis TaxID=286420 RepID=UPI0003730FF7|nr:hypothetical protein [Hahella ganghwensis]